MKLVLIAPFLVCAAFAAEPIIPEPPVLTFSSPFTDLDSILNSPVLKRTVDTHALIQAAAKKHNVHVALVKSIVAAESNFNIEAISSKGAIGLMQLMPATAQEYGADANVPEQNIDAGTRYLRVLLDKYHKYRDCLRRVIAAYNAGPGMVDHYRGIPPFRETRTYVARVMNLLRQFQKERS